MLGANRLGRAAARAGMTPAHSAVMSRGIGKGFQMLGTPTMRGALGGAKNRTAAQAMRSGKRRAAVIGSALALNAAVGPNGSRSTGGRGTLAPRSTGGFA